MIEISERRLERMREVIRKRQYDLTVILENVHDPHNIGAVLRSCDSVGIREIFIIYSDPRLSRNGLEIGLQSSSGAKPWVKVNYFETAHECFKVVKSKYKTIFGTAIGNNSKDLYELKLDQSCALLFGNEHKGITEEAMHYVDQNFLIPQNGFVQSLNISVACAVSLYEACRQRKLNGLYDQPFGSKVQHHKNFEEYTLIHEQKKLNKINNKKII